ncbi:YkgJ family cysteine cluster protein [Hyperthermus butylicus]|uniref:YkgJ family cysteine cluster protein n=1 Tax=Hyperthermus butylicus (strain DSM 5456 / JCM 9403 / PLM1-5) TaxID=415426 RepID=A2BMB9_HYPBU|nr:YkgJ family cysteine cluster protein [Hyperthermus butylicus]ABM81130.1 hypothetical protein Hbut_1300 [Hyperthermus butylicus DSM 5456]
MAGSEASGSVPRFTCLFCDTCCFFREEYEAPVVFPWEKRVLEDLAEEYSVAVSFKPLQAYASTDGDCVVLLYRWLIKGFCPFFDTSTKRCRIHGVKPLACRMYPLLLEMPTGRLMVSRKCLWVEKAGGKLLEMLAAKPELIARVFPGEFQAATEVLVEWHSIMRFLREKGFEPVAVEELNSRCRRIYDIDEYIARFG